jgi:hypothetical protein
MVPKEGFELLDHVDNTQLIHSASGLKAHLPHQPAWVVLYDAQDAEHKPTGRMEWPNLAGENLSLQHDSLFVRIKSFRTEAVSFSQSPRYCH